MNKFMTKVYWMIAIAIGINGLVSPAWAQTEFERFYREIFELEKQLFAFEPDSDYETRSDGDVNKFFNLYYEDLVAIKTSIQNQDNLDPLEKFSLQVYADGVIAGQVWSTLSRIEPSEENHKRYRNGRLKILQFARTNPEENFQTNNHALISWVKGIYSENLFHLAGLDSSGTLSYVGELEREGYESLQKNFQDIRTLLVLVIYHVTISNLDLVNLEKAQRYLNRAFTLLNEENNEISPSLPPGSQDFFRAQTWAWQSQIDLARLDREAAMNSIDQALAIYPKSGFLGYLKTLISVNRLMTQGDGGLIENPDKVNFSYEYSIVSDGKFLYQNYFNFAFDDTIFSPYLGVGNNFTPLALYLEVGGRLKWRTLSSQLTFKHRNSFSSDISEHYSGEVNLGWANHGWRINNRSDVGQIWKYRDQGEGPSFDGVMGVEEELAISYLIFNHPLISIDTTVQGRYFYAWDLSQGLWNGNFFIEFDIFKLKKTKRKSLKFKNTLKLKTGVHFAGEIYSGQLFNRLNFFSESPFPLVAITDPLDYPGTDLVGDWLALISITYQLYPLYSLNTHSAVKSIFVAPSVFLGWVGDRIGEFRSQFSYSALGNIGFTFPGGTSIAMGFGWNEREEWVINLFAY